MEINFSGKKALVTGAGRGIGREIVRLLVRCGAHVVAVSKTAANLESLKQELPSSVEIVCVDLADWNATQKAVQPYADSIDLLVNNAAFAECQPFGSVTEDSFDKQYAINVKAVINVTQIVSQGMKQRKSGSIVNVSSVAGLIGLRNHLVYGGTKASLDLMTKILAIELGEYGIRVNSVNPTVTWTDMSLVGWSDPAKQAHLLSRTPLKRFANPIDVAETVVYLLSDRSAMITSSLVPLDGGLVNCST